MTDKSESNDLPSIIDTTDKMADALAYWKNFTFVPHYLNLKHAMNNMFTDERAVEAKHEYAPRWVVSNIVIHNLCFTKAPLSWLIGRTERP